MSSLDKEASVRCGRHDRASAFAEPNSLPDHLSRMALFVLNTGVRDDVVCSLRWEWEIRIPELGISVFEVPRQHVKGKKRSKIVVCNSVSQSVVESVRGMHEEFVFVYRRERVKNVSQAPAMAYRRIVTMNNTACQRARKEADLGDLRVHDLRHTVGMRLREAGVPEGTRADILWHSTRSMIAPLQRGADRRAARSTGEGERRQRALEQEPVDVAQRTRGGTWGTESPKSPPEEKNGLETEISKPLIHFLFFWCGWQESNPRPLGS